MKFYFQSLSKAHLNQMKTDRSMNLYNNKVYIINKLPSCRSNKCYFIV